MKRWKLRRGKDCPLGVLCTAVLLDVLVKDSSDCIKDRSILSTLYASALTKFINYATSFKLGRSTMYATANTLGIDSFLIDLRHSFAHGQQSFNLDVYRHSHQICMKWIEKFYWNREIDNIKDVDIKDIRYDANFSEKLDEMFTFYDLLAELLLKNFKNFNQLQNSNETVTDRWPLVNEFMKEKKLKNFSQAFKYFTDQFDSILASKEMRLNSKTFFHVMLSKSELFMKASEMNHQNQVISDADEEYEMTPIKRPKKKKNVQSVIQIYQNLIWHIAKNDYLKQLIDVLVQIFINKGETSTRRKTAHFWIEIILKSFKYYQMYCKFTKSNVIDQHEITEDITNIYSYQLGADLRNVLIFVGTHMLPTSLKYSYQSVLSLIHSNDNEDDLFLWMSFLPFVYPPLSVEQIERMTNLVDIVINTPRIATKSKDDRVFTVEDLQAKATVSVTDDRQKIWKLADKKIDWSSLPLGYEFTV